jgi:putative phosphoribosyl transferase
MSSIPIFRDRTEAGKQLAAAIVAEIAQLTTAEEPPQTIVYALPRGGLPVAVPIVEQLQCPLDIVVAKKITTVQNPELAIGALTADGQIIWAPTHDGKFMYKNSYIHQKDVHKAQAKAEAQLAQLAKVRPNISPTGKIAILVDDGIATGMTMAVATKAIAQKQPAQLWIAVPIAPAELMSSLRKWCDRAIILETPDPFLSVSRFYQEFPQVELSEAQTYLAECNQHFWTSRSRADGIQI